MKLTVFKPGTPHGEPYPALTFAAYDEKLAKSKQECEIMMSYEQAQVMCDWLTKLIYEVRLERSRR